MDDEPAAESASSGSQTAAEEKDGDGSTTWAHRDWRFFTAPEVKIGPADERETIVSTSDSCVDPFIGLRFGYDFSYRWAIGFRGDIGGFGIGDAAEFTWQAQFGLGYNLSKKISLIAGYRWLAFDIVTGEGEDRNGQNLTQQGPTIGAGFKF